MKANGMQKKKMTGNGFLLLITNNRFICSNVYCRYDHLC